MLNITPQHRLFIAVGFVDSRRGIDGLKALCERQGQENPFAGHLFIFRNRSGTSVKLLTYDGGGFWLCQKRFSSGKLAWWPTTDSEARSLRAIELMVMLQQGNPRAANVPVAWLPV